MTNVPDPWAIRYTQEGFVLRYDGLPWPMTPKADEQEAQEYLERVRERYAEDTIQQMVESYGVA